jgi:hypothetical protein
VGGGRSAPLATRQGPHSQAHTCESAFKVEVTPYMRCNATRVWAGAVVGQGGRGRRGGAIDSPVAPVGPTGRRLHAFSTAENAACTRTACFYLWLKRLSHFPPDCDCDLAAELQYAAPASPDTATGGVQVSFAAILRSSLPPWVAGATRAVEQWRGGTPRRPSQAPCSLHAPLSLCPFASCMLLWILLSASVVMLNK